MFNVCTNRVFMQALVRKLDEISHEHSVILRTILYEMARMHRIVCGLYKNCPDTLSV